MPPPAETPIGLDIARTAKTVSRAFDDALAAVGGSIPMWQILVSLKTLRTSNQRELAEAVGIRGATLTRHLDSMENDGLLARQRHAQNRRIHSVQLTDLGESAFHRLREAAVAFDQRMRAGLSEEDTTALRHVLAQLRANAAYADSET